MSSYPFTIATSFPNGFNLALFTSTIGASSIGPLSAGCTSDGTTATALFTVDLDAAQLLVLDACVATSGSQTAQLDLAKEEKFAQIDRKTSEIIARGYTWSGVVLSLSLPSQTRLNGVWINRMNPPGGYPIIWNSLDDMSYATLANTADVESMYDAACTRLREVVDSGTVIKDEVRAATTVAEVEAIVDPRV